MGGFIGTKEGVEKYARDLVADWTDQLETLSQIAKSEPQAAYSAFTARFRHKLSYFIRTIPELHTPGILQPFDDKINNVFIPAITEGHICSRDDRRLLSLPVRMGGMGIPIFSDSAVAEYQNSKNVTTYLREKVLAQESDFQPDAQQQKQIESNIRKEREEKHNIMLEQVRNNMSK